LASWTTFRKATAARSLPSCTHMCPGYAHLVFTGAPPQASESFNNNNNGNDNDSNSSSNNSSSNNSSSNNSSSNNITIERTEKGKI